MFDTPRLSEKTAKMLREDLESVEIPYQDDEDRFADFRALRHGFVSSMTNSPDVSAKMAMDLARHSDPRLTFATYSHLRVEDTASALQNLPGIATGDSSSVTRTGTDNAEVVPEGGPQIHPQSRNDSLRDAASRCESDDQNSPTTDDANSLSTSTLSNPEPSNSGTDVGGPGRTRTCDRWIMSPLL